MYLADSLRMVRDGLADDPMYKGAQIFNQTSFCDRILEEYDLYAFEASAMEMAADLRIDTSDRLQGILQAILGEERKIFMEAHHDRRRDALSRLRGFPETHLPPGRYNPERVGIALNCEGNGRATMEVAWVFPKAKVKRDMGDFLRVMQARHKTRLEKDADVEMARLGVCTGIMTIDVNAEPDMTRKEFQERLDAGDPKVKDFRHSADHYADRIGSPMTKRQLDAQAWRDYHLNAIASYKMTEAGKAAGLELSYQGVVSPGEMIENSQRDFDGEVIYMTCLAAVLEAQTEVLKREVRPAKSRRRERAVSQKDLKQDRLSVVSMNISDKALVRALSGSDGQGEASAGGTGSQRIRHPVRGHLFKARNGEIVFRKPHWRGSLLGPDADKKIIRVR